MAQHCGHYTKYQMVLRRGLPSTGSIVKCSKIDPQRWLHCTGLSAMPWASSAFPGVFAHQTVMHRVSAGPIAIVPAYLGVGPQRLAAGCCCAFLHAALLRPPLGGTPGLEALLGSFQPQHSVRRFCQRKSYPTSRICWRRRGGKRCSGEHATYSRCPRLKAARNRQPSEPGQTFGGDQRIDKLSLPMPVLLFKPAQAQAPETDSAPLDQILNTSKSRDCRAQRRTLIAG